MYFFVTIGHCDCLIRHYHGNIGHYKHRTLNGYNKLGHLVDTTQIRIIRHSHDITK